MRQIRNLFYFFTKAVNYYILKSNHVSFGSFQINGIVHVVNNGGTLTIGDRFSANSGKHHNPIGGDTVLNLVVHRAAARLSIGRNTGISNSTIVCWNSIEIGDNVVIGGGCKIWDTDFHSLDVGTRVSGQDNDIKTAPVKIGNNVFIGGSTLVLKGVAIGANSVVAAGSVVYKDIPPDVIAGGNPCRVIKTLTEKT